MQNPLSSTSRSRLAADMVERAVQLPKGRSAALVLADGTVICFGHEQNNRAEKKVHSLERRLVRRGIEPSAVAFSNDKLAWALVSVTAPQGCRARALEAEIERLLQKT
jgi:hypothetical protein